MDHRPHIVVVEDEAAQRQLLVDYLGKQNFRVSGADGGTALRKLLERELPSLVLLDIGLPGASGYEVCRKARAQPWGSDVTFIALTGCGQAEDRRRTQEAGFDGHLVKPVEFGALVAQLDRLGAMRKA